MAKDANKQRLYLTVANQILDDDLLVNVSLGKLLTKD